MISRFSEADALVDKKKNSLLAQIFQRKTAEFSELTKKKSKRNPLTKEDKKKNRELSSERFSE